MDVKNRLLFWRIVLVAIPVCTLAAMLQMAQTAAGLKIQILHSNWKYVFALMSGLAVIALGLFAILWTPWRASILSWMDRPTRQLWIAKTAAAAVLVLLPALFSIAILHPYLGKYYFTGFYPRLLLFWLLSIAGMFCLRAWNGGLTWAGALAVSALGLAAVYRAVVVFSHVTDYPFARGWSEVSRFYGASLFFSQALYGMHVPLPLLHPSWHLLLAPLYFLQSPPMWAFRLWQALLQVGLTAGLAAVLVRRFRTGSRGLAWLAGGWAFLFLMQGPILAPLLVSAILVIAGVDPQKFWRTTLVVLLASLWAGWSRINWFPVPGLIAAAIYLLETRLDQPRRGLAYLWKPLFWVGTGTAAALAANLAFVRWSGNGGGGNFVSSLSSDMLWYRLLPNPTYAHGILLDMVLVSLPLLVSLFLAFARDRRLHPLRVAGLTGILLVLGLGGLVVSVKIGGGSDLHNLDAYLISLLLVGGYLFFGRAEADAETDKFLLPAHSGRRALLIALALVIPIGMALTTGSPVFTWDRAQVERVLSLAKQEIEVVSARGEPVLFISQRQLLALKMIHAPLVPEYEQDALMEMVMSHNSTYLDRFQADLAAQKYGLIVAEPQTVHYYGRTSYFGEENDQWVDLVSIPMLCYYEPFMQPGLLGVTLYVPRETPCK
jgi:hypothetical protein